MCHTNFVVVQWSIKLFAKLDCIDICFFNLSTVILKRRIIAQNKELYYQFIDVIVSCGEFTMDKFQRTKVSPEQLRYAVVPKPLLKQFIFGRSIRCAVGIVFAGLLMRKYFRRIESD